MDYSQWQQPPAPAMQPAEANQLANSAYCASYPYYAQLPNPSLSPNPSSSLNVQAHVSSDVAEPPPPGVDGYSSTAVHPLSAVSVAVATTPSYVTANTTPSYVTANTTPSYVTANTTPSFVTANTTPSFVTANTTPYYTLTTNTQNWAWQEVAQFHVPDPFANTGVGATVHANGTVQPQSICPVSPSAGYKFEAQAQLPGCVSANKQPKKAKVVQSLHCEVCKVDCNSPSVFELHKLGKKHLKNLEKSKAALSSKTSFSLAESTVANPVIGLEEKPCKCKTTGVRKKGPEDLEVKRRKVVEGGATTESIRLCTICNIVCNSEKVYNDHLAGQKHASMMRKFAAKAARKD